MFTGIVESIGTVKSISFGSKSFVLNIECKDFGKEYVLGESIAVNGVCLTVTDFNDDDFSVDATPETFRRTNLGNLKKGSAVNLERAMKANGRFGGHIVSGHVDGIGKILSFSREENAVNVQFIVGKKEGEYIVEKGSVCIDGISLTVANVKTIEQDVRFTVAVIPHTFANTILSKKNAGDTVNIECDIVGKYIRHFMNLGNDNNKTAYDMNDFVSWH